SRCPYRLVILLLFSFWIRKDQSRLPALELSLPSIPVKLNKVQRCMSHNLQQWVLRLNNIYLTNKSDLPPKSGKGFYQTLGHTWYSVLHLFSLGYILPKKLLPLILTYLPSSF